MVLLRAETCKARRVGGSTVGPTGVLTPHFGRASGMGTAAKGVVAAACCVTLSGASLCPHPFEQGQAEGCRGARRGCAGSGRSYGRRALLGSAPGSGEGCSPSAVGGVGWP